MSIVTVHGPNMWGGAGAGGGGTGPAIDNAGGTVTADQSNGLKFSLVGKGDRPAVNYDWTWTPTNAGDSPQSGSAGVTDNKGPITVTFGNAGAKVITLTVGSAGGTTPPATTYTYNVTAASGPRSVQEESAPAAESAPYDPADHTVAEVVEYAHTLTTVEEVDALIDQEIAGKDRTTLVSQLETISAGLA